MNFCCRMFQAGFCITCTVKDMNHSLLLVFFPHLCCQPKTFGGQMDAVLTVFWYFLVFLLVTNECAHHTHVLFVILFLLLNKIENSSVKMLSWRLNSSVAFNIIGQKIEFLGKIQNQKEERGGWNGLSSGYYTESVQPDCKSIM